MLCHVKRYYVTSNNPPFYQKKFAIEMKPSACLYQVFNGLQALSFDGRFDLTIMERFDNTQRIQTLSTKIYGYL
jgi:hypothetical protein